MKICKKIVAVVMAVLTMLSLCIFSASAVEAPTLELKVISQTSSTAVLQLSVVKGKFSSLDVTLQTTPAVRSVTLIETTTDFDACLKKIQKANGQCIQSSYAATKKISIASTIDIGDTSMYEITVSKKSSADLVASDVQVKCDECIFNGVSVASSVKVNNIFSKLEIDESSIALNYKQKQALGLTTILDVKTIVWESSNTNVATVDANGNVYASGTGSAVITAKTKDGKVSDTCNVTVSYAWWQWIIVIVLFGWLWY